MKQVLLKDLENNTLHGGISTDDGDVICGCCGALIPYDEVAIPGMKLTKGNHSYTHQIIKYYPNWINLDEEIAGDDLVEKNEEEVAAV